MKYLKAWQNIKDVQTRCFKPLPVKQHMCVTCITIQNYWTKIILGRHCIGNQFPYSGQGTSIQDKDRVPIFIKQILQDTSLFSTHLTFSNATPFAGCG